MLSYSKTEPSQIPADSNQIILKVYKSKPFCWGMCFCTSCCMHSATIVTNKNTDEKYIVNYGYQDSYNLSAAKLNARIVKGDFEKPAILIAKEQKEYSFSEFKKQCNALYPAGNNFNFDTIHNNCSDASNFTINYFLPEFKRDSRKNCIKDSVCGIWGTLFCHPRCPTFPGINTPNKIYQKAKHIENLQRQFSPAREIMTDKENPLKVNLLS
jgi:hypothetical protein